MKWPRREQRRADIFKVARSNGEDITDEDEDEWYARRLEAGLSVLQSADYVLAWIVMEDDGVSWVSPDFLVMQGR